MPEIRHDPITGRRVIIAPERFARPRMQQAERAGSAGGCPFCTGNEAMTPPEVWAERSRGSKPDTPGWRVRVVPNKYPALEPQRRKRAKKDDKIAASLGVHEVIIESPAHETHVRALSASQWTVVLRAYRARWRALEKDARWRYVLIYKNQGERAGATLEHVHSQLVALPAVPPEPSKKQQGARRHFERTGRCAYCESIERESQRRQRLVLESERFIAFCPFAPRFAYETWILPRSHAPRFSAISSHDLAELAEFLRRILQRLEALAADAPLNYTLHSAPLRESVDPYHHWHLEILPQWNRAAGFEWGTGMFMNPVSPEEAARLLRNAAR